MQKISHSKSHITSMFSFLLIAAFAIFALLLVVMGVQVYRSVVDETTADNQVRTTINYVANKIRAADGRIRLHDLGDMTVLTIGEPVEEGDEEAYETLIYFLPADEELEREAGLYEHSADVTDEFDPELGDMVTRVDSFSITQKDEMMLLDMVDSNGMRHWLHLSSRTSGSLLRDY